MNKPLQRLFSLFLVGLFSVVFASAQENRPIPKLISGGVLNGKASNLVKPEYPAAAKAVNASGAVNVQVTIDENGDVISAAVTSGHPLLREAAVQAARASKFSPTMLSGVPVKVTGVIVYNFVGETMNLTQIGFALGASKFDESFPAQGIRSAVPADWTNAKLTAQSLVNKQNWDRKQKFEARIVEIQRNSEEMKRAETVPGVKGIAVMTAQAPSVEVKESYQALADALTEFIKNHLSNDESRKWAFAFGLAAGKISAQIEDNRKLRQNLAELKQLAAIAPSSVPVDFVNELQKVAALADDGELNAADKAKIEIFAARWR